MLKGDGMFLLLEAPGRAKRRYCYRPSRKDLKWGEEGSMKEV
jgi:hypothetical protein